MTTTRFRLTINYDKGSPAIFFYDTLDELKKALPVFKGLRTYRSHEVHKITSELIDI